MRRVIELRDELFRSAVEEAEKSTKGAEGSEIIELQIKADLNLMFPLSKYKHVSGLIMIAQRRSRGAKSR